MCSETVLCRDVLFIDHNVYVWRYGYDDKKGTMRTREAALGELIMKRRDIHTMRKITTMCDVTASIDHHFSFSDETTFSDAAVSI